MKKEDIKKGKEKKKENPHPKNLKCCVIRIGKTKQRNNAVVAQPPSLRGFFQNSGEG